MFSNYEEFYFFAWAIINRFKLYCIGSAVAGFRTCILAKSIISFKYFFRKSQIVVQSLNSPKFESLLLGDDIVEYFKVALHVKIKLW